MSKRAPRAPRANPSPASGEADPAPAPGEAAPAKAAGKKVGKSGGKDPNRLPTATADFSVRAKAAGQPDATPVFTLIHDKGTVSGKQDHYRDQFGHDYYVGRPGSVTKGGE